MNSTNYEAPLLCRLEVPEMYMCDHQSILLVFILSRTGSRHHETIL